MRPHGYQSEIAAIVDAGLCTARYRCVERAHGRDELRLARVLLATAAAVAGDVVSLLMRRRLGRPSSSSTAAASASAPNRSAKVDAFFARHGGKAVVDGRFTGFLRATPPFVAGSSGLTVRRCSPSASSAR
jgi:membrane protein DedA with SNARE-associated domain